jgi:hypothetical protein
LVRPVLVKQGGKHGIREREQGNRGAGEKGERLREQKSTLKWRRGKRENYLLISETRRR